MANQSHTSYALRGYLFWGVKLTYTINHQEGSLVAGAGAGSRSQDQAPEPRGPSQALWLFLKEKYTTPQWAGISAAIGWRGERRSHSTVGSCFSDYWPKQQKILLQHLSQQQKPNSYREEDGEFVSDKLNTVQLDEASWLSDYRRTDCETDLSLRAKLWELSVDKNNPETHG